MAAHPDDLPGQPGAVRPLPEIGGDLVASDQAIERALSGAALGTQRSGRAYALRASNSKRRWVEQWRAGEPNRTGRAPRFGPGSWTASFQFYRRGFDEDLNHWYSGLNALALAKVTAGTRRPVPR